MKILQTLSFKKTTKKLHSHQKNDLDKAIKTLIENPLLGEEKVGDLAGVRMFKFKMNQQLNLLTYLYEKDSITLLALGSHENFYRDLKR